MDLSGYPYLVIKVCQFLELFIVVCLIGSFVGGLATWDVKYFWLGYWDVEPRAGLVVLSVLFGAINMFRNDKRILSKEGGK